MAGFGKVAVIGYGVITGKVLEYVCKHSNEYSYSVFYVEHEVYPFNSARKYAEANGIEYHQLVNKDDVTGLFEEKAQNDKVLIISASNNYLFPERLIKNKNTAIINFHNALLPELPGRNAPSWAIYNGFRKTGITWHYVTKGVDEGDIIIQKECIIDSDTKAYELAATLMDLANEAFQECFSGIINNETEPKKQLFANNRKVYKSKEIPGNGWFDLDDNPKDISVNAPL